MLFCSIQKYPIDNISDIQKLFGCLEYNQITQLIIITIKDVIY